LCVGAVVVVWVRGIKSCRRTVQALDVYTLLDVVQIQIVYIQTLRIATLDSATSLCIDDNGRGVGGLYAWGRSYLPQENHGRLSI